MSRKHIPYIGISDIEFQKILDMIQLFQENRIKKTQSTIYIIYNNNEMIELTCDYNAFNTPVHPIININFANARVEFDLPEPAARLKGRYFELSEFNIEDVFVIREDAINELETRLEKQYKNLLKAIPRQKEEY